MVGLQSTTASLARCYEGTLRKINYPIMQDFISKRPANYTVTEDDYVSIAADEPKKYNNNPADEEELPF